MLLWLEEAVVEIAMLLATATGLVLLVAAVWYHLGEYLKAREQRRERVSVQPGSGRAVTTTPTTRHASGHSA